MIDAADVEQFVFLIIFYLAATLKKNLHAPRQPVAVHAVYLTLALVVDLKVFPAAVYILRRRTRRLLAGRMRRQGGTTAPHISGAPAPVSASASPAASLSVRIFMKRYHEPVHTQYVIGCQGGRSACLLLHRLETPTAGFLAEGAPLRR